MMMTQQARQPVRQRKARNRIAGCHRGVQTDLVGRRCHVKQLALAGREEHGKWGIRGGGARCCRSRLMLVRPARTLS